MRAAWVSLRPLDFTPACGSKEGGFRRGWVSGELKPAFPLLKQGLPFLGVLVTSWVELRARVGR